MFTLRGGCQLYNSDLLQRVIFHILVFDGHDYFRQAHIPNDDVFTGADGDKPVRNTVQCDKDDVAFGMINDIEISRRDIT